MRRRTQAKGAVWALAALAGVVGVLALTPVAGTLWLLAAFFFGDPYGDERPESYWDVSVDDTPKTPITCDGALAFARARLPAGAQDASCLNAPTSSHTTVIATFRMERGDAGAWLAATYPGAEPQKPCGRSDLVDCGIVLHGKDGAGLAERVRYGVRHLEGGIDLVDLQASAPAR
ncbi:hypothetical protein ACIPUC_18640 [Streptomyces sp. LARHCF249]